MTAQKTPATKPAARRKGQKRTASEKVAEGKARRDAQRTRAALPEKGVRCRAKLPNGEYHNALIDEDVRGRWTWCRSCVKAHHAAKAAARRAANPSPKARRPKGTQAQTRKEPSNIIQMPDAQLAAAADAAVGTVEPDAHAMAAFATSELAAKAKAKRTAHLRR